MKAVVAAFNQEKALVGAFSVITNLRMELFGALLPTLHSAAAPRAAGPPQGGAGLALRAGGGRRVGGRQGRAVQLQVTTEVILPLLLVQIQP